MIALGAVQVKGKVSLLVAVTKDLVGRVRAGDLIKDMAGEVGGTGGGRPKKLAQAGGKNPEHWMRPWRRCLDWWSRAAGQAMRRTFVFPTSFNG